jgi:hypothetical protein
VTYRRGKPLAAYLYLPRPTSVKAARTVEIADGMMVDYAPNGEPIGIELVDPSRVDLASINAVLAQLGAALVADEDLAPLHAA